MPLQEFIPWLATLSVAAKSLATVAIVLVAGSLLVVLRTPPVARLFSLVAGLSGFTRLLIAGGLIFFVGFVLVVIWTPASAVKVDGPIPNSQSTRVEQETTGDNSPAVAVGEGDVHINIEQGRDQK